MSLNVMKLSYNFVELFSGALYGAREFKNVLLLHFKIFVLKGEILTDFSMPKRGFVIVPPPPPPCLNPLKPFFDTDSPQR